LSISLCLLFVAALYGRAQAQSGRRAPRPLSPPTVTPPPAEPEPTPAAKPELKPQTLIVGMNDQWGSVYIPLYMSDEVWRGFIESFKAYASIRLSTEKRMNRKQAVDRAKKETESFVVLLQLGTDDISANIGEAGVDDLVVTYVVFTPGTAKIKDQGRVYARSYRSILGTRLPTGRASAQLNQAGRETAGRVLSALNIAGPPVMR
jgi:hypothetical protein